MTGLPRSRIPPTTSGATGVRFDHRPREHRVAVPEVDVDGDVRSRGRGPAPPASRGSAPRRRRAPRRRARGRPPRAREVGRPRPRPREPGSHGASSSRRTGSLARQSRRPSTVPSARTSPTSSTSFGATIQGAPIRPVVGDDDPAARDARRRRGERRRVAGAEVVGRPDRRVEELRQPQRVARLDRHAAGEDHNRLAVRDRAVDPGGRRRVHRRERRVARGVDPGVPGERAVEREHDGDGNEDEPARQAREGDREGHGDERRGDERPARRLGRRREAVRELRRQRAGDRVEPAAAVVVQQVRRERREQGDRQRRADGERDRPERDLAGRPPGGQHEPERDDVEEVAVVEEPDAELGARERADDEQEDDVDREERGDERAPRPRSLAGRRAPARRAAAGATTSGTSAR